MTDHLLLMKADELIAHSERGHQAANDVGAELLRRLKLKMERKAEREKHLEAQITEGLKKIGYPGREDV